MTMNDGWSETRFRELDVVARLGSIIKTPPSLSARVKCLLLELQVSPIHRKGVGERPSDLEFGPVTFVSLWWGGDWVFSSLRPERVKRVLARSAGGK